MTERKQLSTRTRFEVFKRDGFRCLYCGATPEQGPLHVDHVEAVANGGTNEPANLVTACARCNLGKSAVPLTERALAAPSDASEQLEQLRAYLAHQREIATVRSAMVANVEDYWFERVGYEPEAALLCRFSAIAQEFGFPKLLEAIDIVGRRGITAAGEAATQRKQAQYFHGILRNWRAPGGQG